MTDAKTEGAAETSPQSFVTPGRKIAIFGTTPSRMEGPFQDDSGWERWTIGPGGCEAHNWERLYEVHGWWPEDFKGYLNFLSTRGPKQEVWTMSPAAELMAKWRQQHKKSDEDYAKEITGDWSSNRVVPRDRLMEKYGRTWFTSSISYLFAHAIDEGAKDIGLWGIDLEAGEEYIAQFLGCKYFIDTASRYLGINVHLPKGCGLLREPNPYPDRYETFFALLTQRKVEWLRVQLAQMEANYEATRDNLHRMEGRLIAMRAGGAAEEEIKKGEAEFSETGRAVGNLVANINHLKGELGATEYYRRMCVYQPNDPDTPFLIGQ